MGRSFSHAVEALFTVLSTPWAFLVALVIAIAGFFLIPQGDLREDFHLALTVFTFLLVFLLEHEERRDMAAINVKLNELLSGDGRRANAKIGVEKMPEEDVAEIEEIERHSRRAAPDDRVEGLRRRVSGGSEGNGRGDPSRRS